MACGYGHLEAGRAGDSPALSNSCAARARLCRREKRSSASYRRSYAATFVRAPGAALSGLAADPTKQLCECDQTPRPSNAGLDGHLSQAISQPKSPPKTATPRLSALWRRLRGLSAVSALSAPARSRARRGRGSWPRVGRRPNPPRRAKQRARAPPEASPPSRQGRLP